MTDADGDLSKFREIAVVLGGGLNADDSPKPETLARADAAAKLARERDIALIVSGSRGAGPKPEVTEAEHMARRIAKRYFAAAPGTQDDARAATEELYLGHTRARLEGLKPGDIRRIAERVRLTMHRHVTDDAPRS